MEVALAIIGTLVGLVSFVYAIMTQREKSRYERLVQATLAGIAGSIVMIQKNPRLAHANIDHILQRLEDIESSPGKKDIINYLAWAQGDSAAAHRLLEVLLNDVLTLQEGLFGVRRITSPDQPHPDQVSKEDL